VELPFVILKRLFDSLSEPFYEGKKYQNYLVSIAMTHRMTKSNLQPEDVEIDVTWDDQQRINTFGRLANRASELEEEIAKMREEINKITDASDEIILTDDIKYLIGEVFIDVDTDFAEQLLDADKKKLEKLIKIKETEFKKIQETMKQLKGALYLKFGKNINLD
jgi:prefoldin subunit 4